MNQELAEVLERIKRVAATGAANLIVREKLSTKCLEELEKAGYSALQRTGYVSISWKPVKI